MKNQKRPDRWAREVDAVGRVGTGNEKTLRDVSPSATLGTHLCLVKEKHS